MAVPLSPSELNSAQPKLSSEAVLVGQVLESRIEDPGFKSHSPFRQKSLKMWLRLKRESPNSRLCSKLNCYSNQFFMISHLIQNRFQDTNEFSLTLIPQQKSSTRI